MIEAKLARFIINTLTQISVIVVVLGMMFLLFRLNVVINLQFIVLSMMMAAALGLGIRTLNCYLMSRFPLWERVWGIINRPLFLLSCVLYMFSDIPEPFRDWLWWNPLIHVIGEIRRGIYSTYDGSYISVLYIFAVSMICMAFGLLLLRRYHRDIINSF